MYTLVICVTELHEIFLYFDKANTTKTFLMKVYMLPINKHSILVPFSEFKRKYPFPRENISLLNLHVTPGLHFKNTFVCKLIAFISQVNVFILFYFSSGCFNWVLHSPHFCQSQSYALSIRKGTFES